MTISVACAEAPLPRGDADHPAYPSEWEAFRSQWQAVQDAFEKHIEGARNITIPIAPDEFPWQVDWEAQQAYCRRIADAIFSKPRRAQLAWPDAIAARDGVEKVYEAIGKTFPRCTAPAPTTDELLELINSGRPDPLTRKYIQFEQEKWSPRRGPTMPPRPLLDKSYFLGDDYLIYVHPPWPSVAGKGFVKTSEPRLNDWLWGSWYWEDVKTGCPSEAAIFGAGWEPTTAVGAIDELPAVFLRIDGELVPVEFGRYSYRGREAKSSGPNETQRWEKAGRPFVFVKSLKHGFWLDWAASPVPSTFVVEADPREAPGVTRACVINFDSPINQ